MIGRPLARRAANPCNNRCCIILAPIPAEAETAESAIELLWSQVSDEYAEPCHKPKG